MRTFFLAVISCAVLSALSSCGHKTPLSLLAFRVPQPPTSLAAVQRENVISITWSYSGSETIKDYIVEEKIEKGIIFPPEKGHKNEKTPFKLLAKVTGGAFVEKNILFGQTYVFRVRAESETGVIGMPAVKEVPALTPPPAPQGLGFSIGNTLVTLKWQAGKWNGKDVFYNVYRSAAGSKTETKTKTLLNAAPIAQNTFDVTPNTGEAQVYSVTALLGGKFVCEGKSADITVKPADFVPARPATPSALATPEGVRLIWDANAESWVTGYRVYRRINGQWKPVGFSSVPSFLDTGSKSGDYRITAVGSVAEGPFSETVSVPPTK